MSYLDRRIVVSFVMLCVGCAGGPGPGPSGSEPGSVPGGSGGARPAGAGGARGEAGSGGAAGGGAAGSGGAAGGGAAGSGGQAGKPAIDAAAPADAGPSGAVPPPPIAEEPLPPCKRTVPVAGGGALGGAIAAAMPGDCLVAADGDYPAQNIGAKGNADAPIVVRAANRGKAVFTGRVQLDGATYVVIEGFDYTGGSGVTVTNANHNRITRSHFRLGSGTWISLTGTSDSNRIDHNDLGPLDGGGHFIHPTGMSERTRIDHNHLHDLANCGGNGCESISLGCCGAATDAHETFNVVEYNLLVNCDGEGEMIGMKSSSNTVRFNTIRTSRGHISFRAGKKNTAHSNYILGGGKAGTNGIRMLDEDHLVYNNYVDVSGFPLRMQNGDIPGFPPIKRARVVNNTFVVNGGAIELGGTSHSIAPADSTFANNLIVGSATLINARGADGITLQGNIAFPMGGALGLDRPADQIRVVDPQLTKVGEILRPGTTGPTVDAARPGFPFVTQDIDGRPRTTADVGAHAAGTPGHGPLTPADVGPEAP